MPRLSEGFTTGQEFTWGVFNFVTITVQDNRFIADPEKNQFHIKELKKAGFFFCPFDGVYYSKNIRAALRLRSHLSVKAKSVLSQFILRKTEPWPKSRPFYAPYKFQFRENQIKAIEFCLSRNHSYIAYQMRMGKTAIGVAVANEMDTKDPILVLAPPSILPVWMKEFNYLSQKKKTFQIVHGETDSINAQVILCPHTLLEKWSIQKLLLSSKFSLCLIDEAHRFKTLGGARVKALFGEGLKGGVAHRADKIICFSGTPLMNRPVELYPVLSRLVFNEIGYLDFKSYGEKYCAGHMVSFGNKKFFDTRGASNQDELQSKLKDFMLIDMGEAKGFEEFILPIDCPVPMRLINFEEGLRRKRSIEDVIGSVSLGSISEYRKEMGEAKLLPSIKVIKEALSKDKKLLVLAWHKDMIKDLAKGLSKQKPLVIDGSTPMKIREHYCKTFQDGRKKKNILIAQLSTMEGVDLSSADEVYFVEYDWTPARNKQAFFRSIKIGQDKIKKVFYLVAKDTLDEYILKVLKDKKQVINTLTNRRTPNEQTKFNF